MSTRLTFTMHMCTTLYHIVPHCTTCVPHVYHIPITPKFHFRFTKFKISGLLWWWLKPGQIVIWYRWRIPVQHWQISETTKEIPWMLMKKQKITIMLSYFRMWFHLSFSYFQMCACGIVAQGLAVERRGFLIPGPWVHGCKSFGGGGSFPHFLDVCYIIRLLTGFVPPFLEWGFPLALWTVLVAVLINKINVLL
jgi:hypothetical protein